MRQTTISGRRFSLDADRVELALRDAVPEPIRDHFVVVSGRRFPPKQALAVVTGLDRADFTTHQARAVLRRLGFSAGRRGQPIETPTPIGSPRHGAEADALRPFIGKWVAQRGREVLVAADTPAQVVRWLSTHRQHADMMFRVPASEDEAGGSAP